jgi:hypothetical protein
LSRLVWITFTIRIVDSPFARLSLPPHTWNSAVYFSPARARTHTPLPLKLVSVNERSKTFQFQSCVLLLLLLVPRNTLPAPHHTSHNPSIQPFWATTRVSRKLTQSKIVCSTNPPELFSGFLRNFFNFIWLN